MAITIKNIGSQLGIGNIKFVNNSRQDLGMFDSIFNAAYEAMKMPEEYDDIFHITVLAGFNPDGTDRWIIDMAD